MLDLRVRDPEFVNQMKCQDLQNLEHSFLISSFAVSQFVRTVARSWPELIIDWNIGISVVDDEKGLIKKFSLLLLWIFIAILIVTCLCFHSSTPQLQTMTWGVKSTIFLDRKLKVCCHFDYKLYIIFLFF